VRVAIDTNRLTDLFRGDAELAETLSFCEEVCVPLTVYAEVMAGLIAGSRRTQNEPVFQRFLAKENVRLLLPTRATADGYARLFAQLRTAGTPIPTNDIWIASHVIEEGLALITRDRHFGSIPQVTLLN
jgi:tRNA(fMet)-specific endonuclease VapC